MSLPPQFWWHLARASGIVSWAFGASSVFTGLLLSSRAAHGQLRPNWQLDLHRHQSTISLAALALHIMGLVFDSYVHFGVADVLVPGAAAWKTTPVAFGVIAMYVLLVVQGTSMARKRIPKRVWKTIHLSSLGAYVLSTLHFATAGTDRNNVALQWLILSVSLANVILLVYRILASRARPARVQPRT